MKKKVVVLGSTGSIGKATLRVIDEQKDRFEVLGLSCKENVKTLNEQIERFRPRYVCVFDENKKRLIKGKGFKILLGLDGLKEMIHAGPDIVVNALPGSTGLIPTMEALKIGTVLALANKESVVMAGRIVREYLEKYKAKLIPVDSEHSALYQLLKTVNRDEVKSIILTASGGPFKDFSKDQLKKVRPADALKHPIWKMGKKITLDSATLMNKGLEVIEARWLFGFDVDRIKVLIHPESILHGLLELIDESFMAYMAYPDMMIPISYALNQEERHAISLPKLGIDSAMKLTFYPPDVDRFPALKLAYEALKEGDSAQITLNTSNEVVSTAFLENKIRFTDIPVIIERVLERHPKKEIILDLESVWEIYHWAKGYTEELLRKGY
ncbi:MAG: 1-deoxy-D-xylulose-5-phosphate reductoisomerase [Deltaproteobacteria bacterium]|nr:1-deoxy-D-xylulose-5-phosphate reductoisomerase [Deltaproteobacteria bacterium]